MRTSELVLAPRLGGVAGVPAHLAALDPKFQHQDIWSEDESASGSNVSNLTAVNTRRLGLYTITYVVML